jgi:hypothetical protein
LPSVFGPAEDYSEPTSIPSARIEYIASVLLERDDPTGARFMTAGQTRRASRAIQQSLDAADEVMRSTVFAILSRSTEAPSPIGRIAGHLQLLDANLRGPGYEHQAKTLIEDLFDDPALEAALQRTLGFTPRNALALEDALSELVQQRMDQTQATIEILTNNVQETVYQMNRRGEHVLGITVEELARASGIPNDVARAFLDRFSTGFGETKHTHLLTGLSAIRRRPFVRPGDGRYLFTSPVNLIWALQPAFERALQPEAEWERFQQVRASWIEQRVVGMLGDAVRADARFANLRFAIDQGTWYEIDGIAIVDDMCFVVEAKGGRLSDTARRGRVRALGPELERMVGRGSSQAMRLRDAILEHKRIDFVDQTGNAVAVPLEAVERAEAIVITLEDFGGLLGLREEMVAAGLATAVADIPWIVSVFDFDLVCRLVEFPGQLTLYLKDRRALPSTIAGGDEMNVWMVHLLQRLKFPDDAGRIMLRGDWTEDIDRHFMFGHGALPRMPLSRSTRREVERLNRIRPAGHLRRTEDLISHDQMTRLPEPAISVVRGGMRLTAYAKNP